MVADTYSQMDLRKSLMDKLGRVMHEVSKVEKAGENTHFKFNYAKVEDVTNACSSAMRKENIVFGAEITNIVQTGNKTIVYINFMMSDGSTGYTVTHPWAGEANDNGDKGLSKAISFAKKTFLITNFLITAEDEVDVDGQNIENSGLTEAQRKWFLGELTRLNLKASDVKKRLDIELFALTPNIASNVVTFYRRLNEKSTPEAVLKAEFQRHLEAGTRWETTNKK
jgi:hypothetical protein